jgi:hypothetical protein
MTTITVSNVDKVQVEISSNLLTHLLNSGLLHCGDCKCLNANAKTVIWHTLLASSTNSDHLNGAEILCA